MSNDVKYVVPGIVCFQRNFGSEVATDSTFTINSAPVDRIVGNTVRGVLVIFETDEVFGTSPVTVQCSSGGGIFNLIIFLKSMCFGLYSFCMTITTLFHNLHHYTVFEAPTISGI